MALSPFVLLFAILMPFLVEKWSLIAIVIMAGMELACVSLLMGFWLSAKVSRWAFRVLTGLVFLAYSVYLIYEFFFSKSSFRLIGSRGEDSPRNALLGFIFIGLPCLWYTLFGRFTLRPSLQELDISKSDDKAGDDIE